MDTDKIDQKINIALSRVSSKFIVEKAILFGSYNTSTADDYSDIDLLIVSDDMDAMNYYDRYCALHDLVWDLEPDINIHAITQKEYITKNIPVTFLDAINTGTNIPLSLRR
jgi:predicted nucleotidyltransferase